MKIIMTFSNHITNVAVNPQQSTGQSSRRFEVLLRAQEQSSKKVQCGLLGQVVLTTGK